MDSDNFTHQQLTDRIKSMLESGYFKNEEIRFLNQTIDKFCKDLDEFFGDNDGERLDTDSINFIYTLLKLKMFEHFGEYTDP